MGGREATREGLDLRASRNRISSKATALSTEDGSPSGPIAFRAGYWRIHVATSSGETVGVPLSRRN